MDEIVKDFLIESNENLDRLDQELVKLESSPSSGELLASIFRTIHTIKGSCGFLGFARLEKLAHAGENLLSQLRDGKLTLTPEITSACWVSRGKSYAAFTSCREGCCWRSISKKSSISATSANRKATGNSEVQYDHGPARPRRTVRRTSNEECAGKQSNQARQTSDAGRPCTGHSDPQGAACRRLRHGWHDPGHQRELREDPRLQLCRRSGQTREHVCRRCDAPEC